MIAIVDYGVGNLYSLERSFDAIGADVTVTADAQVIRKAERILLPGVGAFGDAADKLRSSGLADVMVEQANAGKPLLGICLGMQLLFETGYEYGFHRGLGLLSGEIRPIADVIPNGLKIPHMGWNALDFTRESKLFANINNRDFVYFVHSYYAANCKEATIATAEYGVPLTAAVEMDNVFGCQFHPEKSGAVGLKILKAFCEMKV